jgi:tetratricopeptide (TPR) repeat protein
MNSHRLPRIRIRSVVVPDARRYREGKVERSNAALDRAASLRLRGERHEAERLLRLALAKADRRTGGTAALMLARLLEELHRPEEAALFFERVDDLASAVECPEALVDLAAHWLANGDRPRARETYERVAEEAVFPAVRAVARHRLAGIQRDDGLLAQAARNWHLALADASPGLVTHVKVSLAETLVDLAHAVGGAAKSLLGLGAHGGTELERGNSDEAEALLREVVAGDHPDLSPRAALKLAQLERSRGCLLDANQLYGLVIDSEHPEFAPRALAERSELFEGVSSPVAFFKACDLSPILESSTFDSWRGTTTFDSWRAIQCQRIVLSHETRLLHGLFTVTLAQPTVENVFFPRAERECFECGLEHDESLYAELLRLVFGQREPDREALQEYLGTCRSHLVRTVEELAAQPVTKQLVVFSGESRSIERDRFDAEPCLFGEPVPYLDILRGLPVGLAALSGVGVDDDGWGESGSGD